jgi:hypothetical protein
MMTCASIVDITERKRAELRLREANANSKNSPMSPATTCARPCAASPT